MTLETKIYEEKMIRSKFLRKAGLGIVLCLFGVISYGLFLVYRHYHPIDLTPIVIEQRHQCPHPGCASHEATVVPEEYAPSILAGVLLVYCGIVGLSVYIE